MTDNGWRMTKKNIACPVIVLFVFFTAGISAHAASVKILVNSGTGFFVSRGHVVTNLHVVNYCQRIILRGPGRPLLASVLGRDAKHDLALLKVEGATPMPALFRSADAPVEKDEPVLVIGYPGEAAASGQAVVREATIVSPTGPQGEKTWLQLSDSVEQGNSGGPLLDAAGNVVGVIVAKAVIYTYLNSAPLEGTYSQSGVAIALPVVEDFLKLYRVPYRFARSNAPLPPDQAVRKAQPFIVNVRCETPTEVR